MGGIGTYVNIEAVDPPAGKRRSTPRALHRAINKSISDNIWRRCGYGWLRQTAGNYLQEEIGDNYHEGIFSSSEAELSWGFMDHAGCCSGSSYACYHWYDACLAGLRERYDKMAAGRGWRITSEQPNLHASLLSSSYPLASLAGKPTCVPAFALGRIDWEDRWGGPFWDDGAPRPTMADLSGKDRDGIVRAAITGRCQCGVCVTLLQYYQASLLESLEEAWLRTGDAALQALCKAAAEELRAGDWTADATPTGAHAAVCEALGDSTLDPADVAGICFRVVQKTR